MAFWVLNHPREEAEAIAQSILKLKDGLRFCRLCNNLSDTEICLVCSDTSRDEGTVCVVEDPKDVLAIERTGSFNGHYHVLMGSISPADGRVVRVERVGNVTTMSIFLSIFNVHVKPTVLGQPLFVNFEIG